MVLSRTSGVVIRSLAPLSQLQSVRPVDFASDSEAKESVQWRRLDSYDLRNAVAFPSSQPSLFTKLARWCESVGKGLQASNLVRRQVKLWAGNKMGDG